MAWLRGRRPGSVARQILMLQLLVVLIVVLSALALAYLDARADQRRQAGEAALAVATTTADSPQILAALATADPSAQLQPWAERIRRDTGTDFVVVMSPDGVRYTHPDPKQIGGHYLGSIAEAQRGESHVEQFTGTLGPSVRAIVPVRDGSAIVALVAVGITTAAIERSLSPSLIAIAIAAGVVLAAGAVGAWAISRRLNRQTHGLGEREITRMFEYYDAVLHAVREGLVLLDPAGRVQLVNDEGRELLGLDMGVVGQPVGDLKLPEPLVDSVLGEGVVTDEIHLVGPRMLVVNKTPAVWSGRVVGSVITLRDHTDLQAISGELNSAKGLADTLRSQNHEAANRLHTVVSLIEMGRPDDAVEFATRELEVAQRLTDRVVTAVDEPVLAAVLLGKSAQAQERGIDFTVEADSRVSDLAIEPSAVVTMVGNLVDNAMDAAVETGPPHRVAIRVVADREQFRLTVDDSGPGLSPAEAEQAFRRGWSTKGTTGGLGRGIGLALVVQAVRSRHGTISVDRGPLGGARFEIVIGPEVDRDDGSVHRIDQAESAR
ncbi:MAG TPA: sensor histidine kinase [Propionibacteriaceae bacterium]|nr:sensor histidine kinase [Propionibacteriaceae bacterium]